MTIVNIFLADDHPIVRDGVKSILATEKNYNIVGEAETGPEAIKAISNLKPDLVLMDISMPELDGILVTERLFKELPGTQVVILSMHKERHYAVDAFRAGARGYILKGRDSNEILLAIKQVMSGSIYVSPPLVAEIVSDFVNILKGDQSVDSYSALTLREKEVLKLVAEGYTNKVVAEKLYLAVSTIKSYRANIMKKLKINDTAGLVKLAVQKGIVTLD